MVILGVLLLAGGTALLGAGGLAWAGRWRGWTRRIGGIVVSPIAALPALGLFLAVTGGAMVGAVAPDGPTGGLLVLAALLLTVLNVWQPRWFGPRWLREERARGPAVPDHRDRLTALSVAAVGPTLGPRASGALLARRLDGTRRLARWHGTWVFGAEDAPEPGGSDGRAGVIAGRLSLHESAFAFAAGGLDDRLRGTPTTLVVERERFRGARVVPRGAGPDGRRAPGPRVRSLWPRLVVDTVDGPYLFEVVGARRKARRITRRLAS